MVRIGKSSGDLCVTVNGEQVVVQREIIKDMCGLVEKSELDTIKDRIRALGRELKDDPDIAGWSLVAGYLHEILS